MYRKLNDPSGSRVGFATTQSRLNVTLISVTNEDRRRAHRERFTRAVPHCAIAEQSLYTCSLSLSLSIYERKIVKKATIELVT